jgi:intron-binding protein aquarius
MYRGEHSSDLFRNSVNLFEFYLRFEINSHTGASRGEHDIINQYYEKVHQFQRISFKYFTTLKPLSLFNCAVFSARDSLTKYIDKLNLSEIRQLVCEKLCLASEDDVENNYELLRETVVLHLEKHPDYLHLLNKAPLISTEKNIFGKDSINRLFYKKESCFALPKLNTQFLSIQDCFLRSFILFQLESTYAIQEEIQDVATRVCRNVEKSGITSYRGWSKMGKPIISFKIIEAKNSNTGEKKPSMVLGEIVYNLESYPPHIREEWDEIRKHDDLYLFSLKSSGTIDRISKKKSK